MTGPNLNLTDPSAEKGFAPPRLKRWLSLVPKDIRIVVDWVIANFVPNESNAANSGQGGGTGTTITVTVEDASGYTGGGVTELGDVSTLTFDSALFEIYDGGGGQCVVKLKTTTCP